MFSPRPWRVLFFVLLLVTNLALAQGPPPNIVAEGIPPVPVELKVRMNQYLNMRSASFSDWHPTERSILILTRFGDTAQVHLVRSPGAYRQQLTFFPDYVRGARYAPRADKNYFVFSMDTGGSEFFQFYRFDLADGSYHLLTDGRSRNEGLLFNHRGTSAAYMSTRRNGRDFDLYTFDPENPATEKPAREVKGQWMPLDWSPDDSRLLLLEEISVNESYLHVFDLATRRSENLTPTGAEKVAYGTALWAKDGKGIYLSSDRGSEFSRLFYYDLGMKTFTPLSDHIPWDVEDLDLSRDGRVLAFTANEDGISKLHLLETATRRELPAPQLPQGQVFNLKFHHSRNELALNIDSAKSPSDVYTYDLKTKKLERWTCSETGGLNADNFPEAQLIHYPTFDQVNGQPRVLAAFLTCPPAKFKPPYPVLLDIHGGPEGQARPGFQGRYNYYLNEMGLALLEPNVRGSTGYGKSFTKLDNGLLREDSVKDIGALLEWVAKQPDLDTRRVAVMGGSYGGYMSLATMTHYSDRLRCGVDIVGISNFVTFLESTMDYRRDLRRVEYGDERDPKTREFLISISPLTNAAKIRVSMLVVQGQNDPRVPVGEAQQIVKQVRGNGGEVCYILATDEGHGFRKKQNSDFLLQALVMFLEKYLLKP
jgi:dipeptidyl aminopeptidase/acylaminoacyl peptidase